MKVLIRMVGLKGCSNMGQVAWNVWRGAQPNDRGYDTLAEQHITDVINLRAFHDDKEQVEAAGMVSHHYPMIVLKEIPFETLDEIIGIMQDEQRQTFIHCAQGHDRTGAICASYRTTVDGWTVDDAMEEMLQYGYFEGWEEMRDTVQKYTEYKKG